MGELSSLNTHKDVCTKKTRNTLIAISSRITAHDTKTVPADLQDKFSKIQLVDEDALKKLKAGGEEYIASLKQASDRCGYDNGGFTPWLKKLVEGRRRMPEISDYAQPSLYQPASTIASPDVVPSTLILVPLFAVGYYLARRFLKPRTESKQTQELKEVVIEHTD